ncbi:RnfH family protein [Escherichia coli]|nr:RnfH family protein [Escherichia coli]
MHDGDRVEIYRPLIADPKRAAQATSRKNQRINNRQKKKVLIEHLF